MLSGLFLCPIAIFFGDKHLVFQCIVVEYALYDLFDGSGGFHIHVAKLQNFGRETKDIWLNNWCKQRKIAKGKGIVDCD